MQTITFDLRDIADEQAFYRQFAHTFSLTSFGNNLDALWDALTGGIALPLQIRLSYVPANKNALQRIIQVLQEAEQETAGALTICLC